MLNGLNATPLPEGQITAVLGRNGMGKSTLLRCVAGFLPCQASQLHLDDLDLRSWSAPARAAVLRYLPQAAPGTLHLSVYDCIRVALNAGGQVSYHAGQPRIAEVAQSLGITDLLPRFLDELSGGQKQLVWLAQALVHRPRVLLLDEPLAALDINFQHHVMKLLRLLARQHNLIVMIVLHDLNMALRYADHALVLHEGTVVAQGAAVPTLSAELLAQAFLVDARVEHCSRGVPHIVVDDLVEL